MAKAVVRDDVQKLNIRNAMSTAPGTDEGDLFPGDAVYGTVLGNWIAFDKVYRKVGAPELFPGKRYAAIANPLNLTDLYMTITNEAEPGSNPNPTPAPEIKPLKVTIEGQDYQTVVVELKPK